VQLRVMTEPQMGATYDELLSIARATEDLGFDGYFSSDHYLTMRAEHGPGPTDAWVTLAGLARETSRIRLGTLVTPVTFRQPGVLAISVAQVDQMSGGRVELGLGTGWFEAEHTAYGIPFPPLGERFERLEEQLQVVRGLWSDGPFDFQGRHYQVSDSPGLPKPVQRPGPPVVMGGFGPRRTPRLAATYADEYNVPFRSLGDTVLAFDRLREACALTGREVLLSAAQTIAIGKDDGQVRARAAAIGQDPDRLREGGLCGTPSEVVDKLGRLAEAGASRVYLQTLDLSDLDHLELVASEVLPQV